MEQSERKYDSDRKLNGEELRTELKLSLKMKEIDLDFLRLMLLVDHHHAILFFRDPTLIWGFRGVDQREGIIPKTYSYTVNGSRTQLRYKVTQPEYEWIAEQEWKPRIKEVDLMNEEDLLASIVKRHVGGYTTYLEFSKNTAILNGTESEEDQKGRMINCRAAATKLAGRRIRFSSKVEEKEFVERFIEYCVAKLTSRPDRMVYFSMDYHPNDALVEAFGHMEAWKRIQSGLGCKFGMCIDHFCFW